jgi:hypothetical protein
VPNVCVASHQVTELEMAWKGNFTGKTMTLQVERSVELVEVVVGSSRQARGGGLVQAVAFVMRAGQVPGGYSK